MDFIILEELISSTLGKISVIREPEGITIKAGGISQSGWLIAKIWDKPLENVKRIRPSIIKILVLGLGAGSLVQILVKYWKNAKVLGIDIDPVMIELGKKYMGIKDIQNLEIIQEDVEKWIKKPSQGCFDLILVDLCIGNTIPRNFTTREFAKRLSCLLIEKGIVIFNHLYYYWEDKVDSEKLYENILKIFSKIEKEYSESNLFFICTK
jgi:spermidine synthase